MEHKASDAQRPTPEQVAAHMDRIYANAAQCVREVYANRQRQLAEIGEMNAELRAQYQTWVRGEFCERVLRPQRIAVLRQATGEQLEARRRFISRMSGAAYHTETLNIERVLRERANGVEPTKQKTPAM